MITVQSFDNLQMVAPEIEITHLNTPYGGFCSLGIQLPEEIELFFKQLLEKAKEHTDAFSCEITLSRNGEVSVNMKIPNRVYRISTESLGGVIPREKQILTDAAGHERVVTQRMDLC